MRGATAGPSGMTSVHLRLLLDGPADLHLLFQVGEILDRGEVSGYVAGIIRSGRLIALWKPGGGVRRIVAGDILRRLVGRPLAQQLGKAVDAATSPFQYALSTRAGSECVAHVLQAMTERNSDGISVFFDLVSRNAMLEGLRKVPGGDQVLSFVLMFYCTPSTYLWNDSNRDLHQIEQGEGGEQGDALMPLLFSLGQHQALEAVQRQLLLDERLLAFLDDIYTVTRSGVQNSPKRIVEPFTNPHSLRKDASL